MRNILITIFPCLLFAACGGNFDERLKNEAQKLTQNHCPQQVDDITTLDSVVYNVNQRVYIRYFTLKSSAYPVAKENRLAVKMSLLDELKNDASWKRCKDEKISFEYVYHDGYHKNSKFTILLKPKDYQGN